MANQGDQVTVTTRLDPNDTKAVLGVLVSDALNQPGEDLPIGWDGLRLHDARHAAEVIRHETLIATNIVDSRRQKIVGNGGQISVCVSR
jgi:hypothetical protein